MLVSRITIALLIAFVTFSGRDTVAQDLEYTSVTAISAAGPLAPMMNMAGAAGQTISAHAFMKGSTMRIDFGTASTIINATAGEMTMLDHTRKTYSTSPFAQPRPSVSDSFLRTTPVSVTVTQGRENVRVNGLATRRTNIVARVPARNPKAARAADLVVVLELWTSNDGGVGIAYDRAAVAADQFGGGVAMLVGMMAQNPRVGAALHKATEASTKVKGLPVRRIMTYGNIRTGSVFVPGMRIDTVMSTRTDIVNVKTAALPASLFAVPPGYTSAK